jgi:hypothetical protein
LWTCRICWTSFRFIVWWIWNSTLIYISNYPPLQKAEKRLAITTRTSVISIRTRGVISTCKVQFPPAQCDFTRKVDTYECNCDTHECNINTHKIVVYTQTKIFTRRLWFYTFACEFDTHECDSNTHKCDSNTYKIDFYTQGTIYRRRLWF